jgi:PX domain
MNGRHSLIDLIMAASGVGPDDSLYADVSDILDVSIASSAFSDSIGGGALARPKLGLQVIDYNLIGDAKLYECHEFTVEVWVGQNNYAVDRTYADFCEFHRRLQRKYPKTELPALPLNGLNSFTKKSVVRGDKLHIKINTGKEGNPEVANDLRASMTTRLTEAGSLHSIHALNAIASTTDAYIPNSVNEASGGSGSSSASAAPTSITVHPLKSPQREVGYAQRRSSILRRGSAVDTSELISQKKEALTQYLLELIQIPEIATSDNLLDFLDEESNHGKPVVGNHDVADVDILLAGEVCISALTQIIKGVYILD